VPTELGITLIEGYQLIDPELCRPHVSGMPSMTPGSDSARAPILE